MWVEIFKKRGLHFSFLSLHLPLGHWRLITYRSSSITFQVLICGYVHYNQLELEREGGGRQEERRKDTLLQSFLTAHTHIWHSLKHIHRYTITHTHTHSSGTQTVSSPACLSISAGQCQPVILMGTRSGSALYTVHSCTTTEWL